jgi:hypothetical protein
MPTVFISYVHEDDPVVQRLVRELTSRQIKVWLDKRSLAPGSRWKDVIRRAISTGDFFLACFSDAYSRRSSSYMNEELTLAVEELRRRATDRAWFIPVLLSADTIPDRSIGAGETLRDIHGVDLYRDWDEGIKRILGVIRPDHVDEPQVWVPKLSDKDWLILLHRIRKGKCTPFLGAAVNYGRIPDDATTARAWAADYDYPEGESLDLARVAQFLTHLDNMFPHELIRKRLKAVSPPNLNDPAEPHMILANLPLPIYIVTNYDDFLIRALNERNRTPKREFHRWNDQLRRTPSIFDDSDFEPTVSNPVVFHLYGHAEVPESMVVTEDDYREFLANTSRNVRSLPPRIERALTGTLPLFLGYDPSDEKFGNLIHILIPYLEINVLRPGAFKLGAFRIPKYLEHQFFRAPSGTSAESFREFLGNLRRRWEEAQLA